MSLWEVLSVRITAATGKPFTVKARHGVSGGCINSAYRLRDGEQNYFAKLNQAGRLTMFEAEAEGLSEIAATGTLRVPQPICWGTVDDQAYLVLEYLSLRRDGNRAMAALGRGLALMHRAAQPLFGWHRDNHIGATPQINTPCEDWTTFWRRHRLGYQLDLATGNGYGGNLQRQGERLLAKCDALFESYSPVASLLHGDLWSGNKAGDAEGRPVIFDPAVYYGDREADLAMTELFGGFSSAFYSAYRDHYPLDEGYRTRRLFYNLYHVVNHLNLFGGGYLSQAERTIEQLLAELS